MKIKNFLANALVSLSAFLLILFVADKVLALIGYEPVQFIAYPPNFSSKVWFIDHFYDFKANRKGIRYPDIPFRKTSPDEFRVAVIGDSFVEGDGVRTNETFSAILEKQFSSSKQKVSFINCGVAGAGPDEYETILYDIAFGYEPDKVLITIYANDLYNTYLVAPNQRAGIKSFFNFLFPKVYGLLRAGRLKIESISQKSSPPSLSGIDGVIQEARNLGISEDKIKTWKAHLPANAQEIFDQDYVGGHRFSGPLLEPDYWSSSLDIDNPKAEEKWGRMKECLFRMTQACRYREIPVAIVYCPAPYQYDPYFDALPQSLGLRVRKEWLVQASELEKRLKIWANEQNISFLTLTPFFQKAAIDPQNILNYRIDQHWNPKGHALAAQCIAEWLKANLLSDVST